MAFRPVGIIGIVDGRAATRRPPFAAYRSATRPCARKASMSAGPRGTNLPSPWRTGISISPSPRVHTQRLPSSNRTLTHRSSNFPESLWTRDASCAPVPERLGSTPIFTRTWKPLQIPMTRPPPPMKSARAPPRLRRKSVANTLPDPRWSPNEKPPGKARMRNRERSFGSSDQVPDVDPGRLRAGMAECLRELQVRVDAEPGDDAGGAGALRLTRSPARPPGVADLLAPSGRPRLLAVGADADPESALTSPRRPQGMPGHRALPPTEVARRDAHQEPRRGLAEQEALGLAAGPVRHGQIVQRHRPRRDRRPGSFPQGPTHRPAVGQIVTRPHKAPADGAMEGSIGRERRRQAHGRAGSEPAAGESLEAGAAQLSPRLPDDEEQVPGGLEVRCLRVVHVAR